MKCNSCNKELPDGTNFCTGCGSAQSAAPQQIQQTSQHVYQDSTFVRKKPRRRKTVSTKAILSFLIGVICFVLIILSSTFISLGLILTLILGLIVPIGVVVAGVSVIRDPVDQTFATLGVVFGCCAISSLLTKILIVVVLVDGGII